MDGANKKKKSETFPDIDRSNKQDVADEHVFDFLVALRGPAQEEHRRRRRHDVANADNRLLRDRARPFPGHRKNRGPEEGEAERDEKSGPAF